MSSNEYWAEKTVTWNAVKAGLAVCVFAFAALLLAESLDHLTIKAGATEDLGMQQDRTAFSDVLTDKEFHLLNCLYCE